jgi:alpha-L-fucosidase
MKQNPLILTMNRHVSQMLFCLGLSMTLGLLAGAQEMDKEWGDQVLKLRAADSEKGELFNDGNYAMFIHWGLYSQIANQYKGKTYYGIGEWIMHRRMANIPFNEYKKVAKEFNPTNFDAKAIAKLAKDAGMKYVIITAKHHDGFAMFDTKVTDYNIVKMTPYAKDPMKELAEACRAEGLGFGFYYSHYKDWTTPGASRGPTTDTDGIPVTFEEYFQTKCLPQVKELTENYGPLELIWFDTPGRIEKKYVDQLTDVVRKNQPNALINGRIGAGGGDYQSLGDMEVPRGNVKGMWETVDTTNDSWAYAWYDQHWKTPKEILRRLIATVARGGTYMLNIGPRGDGSVPVEAQKALRTSGAWIQRYPFVVYGTDASPWGHALPWGDVTVKENRLFLSIYEMPADRVLNLPGLKSEIASVSLISGGEKQPLSFNKENGWTRIGLPCEIEETLIPVIEVELSGTPEVDSCWGIDPAVTTELLVEFADVQGAVFGEKKWMEKFGEWKHVYQASSWQDGGTASWEVDVLEPGTYQVDLTYAGEGRIVWSVGIENGEQIQNQQNSSHNYQTFPIGWIQFEKTGRHRISASCLEGNLEKASLKAIRFKRIELN